MGIPLKDSVRSVAALTALILGAAGCGLLPGQEGGSAEEGGGAGSSEAEAAGDFVREGYTGDFAGARQEARIEVTELATVDGMTRLTAEYTSLADEPMERPGAPYNTMEVQRDFQLIDTAGQKLYLAFDSIGSHYGDGPGADFWLPGVTHELVAYFPEIEDPPETLTVQGPGSIGEIPGVPLTEGGQLDTPEENTEFTEREGEPPQDGDRVALPVHQGQPESDDEPKISTLVPKVERVVGGRETEGDSATVALRSDVLFAFDEAELGEDATEILAEVVAETKENADPEQPPISVIGHTDGIGEDNYNKTLSEDRAEAVRSLLEEELGSGYEFETEGRGATEPVEDEGGEDDAWARAQNRRVEIGYRFAEDAPAASWEDTETEEEVLELDPDQIADPAAPRSNTDLEPAGEVAFTQEYFFGEDRVHDWTVRFFPFYRDGPFLVARYEATLEDGTPMAKHNPFRSDTGPMMFTALDPATGTIYPHLEAPRSDGQPTRRAGNHNWPGDLRSGSTQYGSFYIPAPATDVQALDIVAGGYGTVPGVPIED